MAKETFTKAAEKPKRDFGTWMGILTLAGMGLICTGGAVGGIYLAAVSFATQPAAAAGGLIMSAAMGFVLPKISSALRDQFTGPHSGPGAVVLSRLRRGVAPLAAGRGYHPALCKSHRLDPRRRPPQNRWSLPDDPSLFPRRTVKTNIKTVWESTQAPHHENDPQDRRSEKAGLFP